MKELKKQGQAGLNGDPATGNRRIAVGIVLGGGTGFLLGAVTTALLDQPRWLGVGLVFGATLGLVIGAVGAARLRQHRSSR